MAELAVSSAEAKEGLWPKVAQIEDYGKQLS